MNKNIIETDSLDGNILKMNCMKSIKAHVEGFIQDRAHDVLFAFDIDMTLTYPEAPASYPSNIQKFKHHFREITQHLTSDQLFMLFTLSVLHPPKLMDEYTPHYAKELLARNIKTIAFTGAPSGPLFDIHRIEEHRFHALKALELDFSTSFPHNFFLEDLEGVHGRCPAFYNGILYASRDAGEKSSKGVALLSFLKVVDFLPNLIIFIDDNIGYLKDVQRSLKNSHPHIEFVGIEYTAGLALDHPLSEEDFCGFWKDLTHQVKALC